MRFCYRESLFGIRQDMSAAAKELKGPKELVSKVLKGKTDTVKRCTCKAPTYNTVIRSKRSESKGKKASPRKRKKNRLFTFCAEYLPINCGSPVQQIQSHQISRGAKSSEDDLRYCLLLPYYKPSLSSRLIGLLAVPLSRITHNR